MKTNKEAILDRFSLAFIAVKSTFILIKEKGRMTNYSKTLKLMSVFTWFVGTFWDSD